MALSPYVDQIRARVHAMLAEIDRDASWIGQAAERAGNDRASYDAAKELAGLSTILRDVVGGTLQDYVDESSEFAAHAPANWLYHSEFPELA